MSIKKELLTVLVAGAVMLALGGGSTYALPAPALSVAASGNSNAIGSNFTIANDAALTEANSAVAYNPDREEYLVVWYNDRPGNDDIQAQRVSKDGTLVGGAFYISGGSGADRRFPDVAYNSAEQEYLVVWEHYDQSTGDTTIYGARVRSTGGVSGSPFPIFNGDVSMTPAVAYASTENKYLVVWSWFDLSGTHIMGRTVAVASSGVTFGSTIYISKDTSGTAPRVQPDLAYNRARNEFLVVWVQANDIYARRVSGSGAPLNPASINISTLGGNEEAPAVGALPLTNNEGDYLVAWEINTGSDTGIDAKTVHVASDGSATVGVLPGIVYDSSLDESAPAVAGNESNDQYLVTWSQHYEVDLGGGLSYVYDGIAGKAVSSDGHLLNGSLFDPGTELGGLSADNSAVAAGPLGDFLVTFDDTALASSRGIYGQLWGNRIYLPLVLRNH